MLPMFARHSTMSTIYIICLEMSQATWFFNFEKKLINIHGQQLTRTIYDHGEI